MRREELDVMWHQALHESIAAGEKYARYHFAALVAAHERELCAKACEDAAAAELRKQYEEIVRLTEALHMEEAISFRRQLHEVQAELEATERQVEILSDELSKCGKVNEALRAELERVAPGYAALARAGEKE